MEQKQYRDRETRNRWRNAASNSGNSLSREQLLALANDLDISAESVQAAEALLRQEETVRQERRLFDRMQRRKFRANVAALAMLNLLFLVASFVTGSALLWLWSFVFFVGSLIAMVYCWAILRHKGKAYARALVTWQLSRLLSDKE